MAARGTESKNQIINQILTNFEGAFKYDKEIRIPMMENGEEIQIKVTLTAAKTNVEHGADTALPSAAKMPSTVTPVRETATISEPTEEEKRNLAKLMASLNM